MAETTLWRIAKLLDDFAEHAKLWGFAGELGKLKKTVSSLQNVAPDAEERSVDSDEIEAWLRGLKAALNDAEDLLEEWDIEVTTRGPPSRYEKLKQVITSFSPSSPLSRVRKIRKSIESIAAKGRKFDLREQAKVVQDERGSRNKERSDDFVYEEEIIGREGEKSAIMKLLLDSGSEEKISVILIHGDEKIGKTALARCLYKDDMVNKHFDLMIWLFWGSRGYCDYEFLLRQIIESGTTETADDLALGQLQNQVWKHILGKKFLLVLGDVDFNFREPWGSLKGLLMGGAEGSKILMTTRISSIARSMGTVSSFSLDSLSESSSLDLLMRMAGQEEEETGYSKKLAIGRRLVRSCDGIPLYIRMLGGALFFKKTEAEWLHFAGKFEITKKEPHAIGLRFLVEICYRHLPSHLKPCFALCSLFPRYRVIDKLMLTSLWMAAGFIQPIDNLDRDTEDIAHDYFMDLLRRNFFQDCIKDELGNVTSCRMHETIYDLAQRVALTERSIMRLCSWPLSTIDTRTHHFLCESTCSLSGGLPTNLLEAKHLRTFIRIDQNRIRRIRRCTTTTGENTLSEFISKFKFLRALDWHGGGIEKLPSSICELKCLTFLDLSENERIVSLPDSITRLQNLQVLKLNMCCKLIELPAGMRKLVNLRQLEISNCSALSHMPRGLGQLTLLNTLTDFILPGDDSHPGNCGGLGELNRLNNLRGSLRIEVKGEIENAEAKSHAANLEEKDSLASLVLVFSGKESDEVLLERLRPSINLRSLEIRGYEGARFPSWLPRMRKLVKLRLFNCAGCKSLPRLGELTGLKRLEIGKLPLVECTESDLHTLSSLPNLSELRIWDLEWIPPLRHLKELKNSDFPLESLQTSVAKVEHVIGIDDRVKDVIKLLETEDDKVKVRIIGIHGTDGIGKTTIAKAVYNRLSCCFDSCSFLAEIGEAAQTAGIQPVQTKLMCDILERDGNVASFKGGIEFFLDIFRSIKVLVVLDDVQDQSYLDDLVGDQLDWFGSGSRIIVTSENAGILQAYVSRGLARTYEVNEMDNDRALELFRNHALGAHGLSLGYPEIAKRIIKATGQVPLVIEVVGSFLCGKTIKDWRRIEDLTKPRKENSQEILKDCREILKICYDALDEKQKQIFWDIVWFADGVDSRIASYMWADRDLLASHQVLVPLAKIGEDNKLWMHKLMKHLCRIIDQKEPKYLYADDTKLKVINWEEGMEKVEALCFDFKNGDPHTFTETNFKSMPNIRFLKLDHASMTGNFANVFPKLRWLRWQGSPRDFEATEFNLTELVILDLSWSKITEDWGGWQKIKMEQLKVLNLTGCTDLLISPTFSCFPNLEILILERCSRLVYLDPSVGSLKKLLCLNLKSCTELSVLPAELGGLKALKELLIDDTSVEEIPLEGDLKKLETLSASNCLSLSLLPHSFEHLTSLSILSVDNSKITKLPNSLGELVKLQRLSLRDCRWIQKLPESIGRLGSSLEELDISGTGISKLPNSFENLRSLRVLKMDYCFIREFPSFIWRLYGLEEIHASSCRSLKGEIPSDIGELIHLRILRLQYSGICRLPSEIKHLSKLETLDLLHCDMLSALPELPSGLVDVRLSQKLKEKMSQPSGSGSVSKSL